MQIQEATVNGESALVKKTDAGFMVAYLPENYGLRRTEMDIVGVVNLKDGSCVYVEQLVWAPLPVTSRIRFLAGQTVNGMPDPLGYFGR